MTFGSCRTVDENTVTIPEINDIVTTSPVTTTEAETVTEAVSETKITTETETLTEDTTTGTEYENNSQELRLSPDAELDIISEPYCRASALYCIEDDIVLYADNIHIRTSPASPTKLLTASVAFKYMSADAVCTIGTEQSMVGEGSSICYVLPGQKLILSDLVTGMLMASGNDAAYAVAVNTARSVSGDENMSDEDSVQYFCRLMNEFSPGIGMDESHFTTPDGWDDEGQYTTVADLIKLTRYAMDIPEIRDIAGTYRKNVVYYSGESNTWYNSNKLLDPDSAFHRSDAIGVKTGTTDNAGSCLIAAFEDNGKTYITVAAGCSSDADRYDLTIRIADAFLS